MQRVATGVSLSMRNYCATPAGRSAAASAEKATTARRKWKSVAFSTKWQIDGTFRLDKSSKHRIIVLRGVGSNRRSTRSVVAFSADAATLLLALVVYLNLSYVL